jgi:hypothetical protein
VDGWPRREKRCSLLTVVWAWKYVKKSKFR